MNYTVIEDPVISSDEPPQPAPEDPLLSGPGLPVLHVCSSDCSRCPVGKEILNPAPVTKHGARRRQAEFNASAFGFRGPVDKYTKCLHEKEASFNALKRDVEGCSKITNGTRVRMESMLRHAECALEQEIDVERALYVDVRVSERTMVRTDEEVDALLHGTAMTPEESVMLLERLRSLLGGSDQA